MSDYKNYHWGKRIGVEIFIVALIGLVMGFLGPFGTYALPSGLRIAYWVVFGIIGYMMFRPIAVVAHWMRGVIPMPEWLAELLGCMVAALPFTLLVSYLLIGFEWDWAAINNGFALLYVQCTAVGFGIYLFMTMLFRNAENKRKQSALLDVGTSDSETSPSKLHERLPFGFPKQIDALQAEDHYVHVYAHDDSAEHKEMLLMRLSDAIKETNMDGIQPHRSWWVARDAVAQSKRMGRGHRLILRNGQEVPVSQANVPKLKTLGMIED